MNFLKVILLLVKNYVFKTTKACKKQLKFYLKILVKFFNTCQSTEAGENVWRIIYTYLHLEIKRVLPRKRTLALSATIKNI